MRRSAGTVGSRDSRSIRSVTLTSSPASARAALRRAVLSCTRYCPPPAGIKVTRASCPFTVAKTGIYFVRIVLDFLLEPPPRLELENNSHEIYSCLRYSEWTGG